jgi:hypothetical protein
MKRQTEDQVEQLTLDIITRQRVLDFLSWVQKNETAQ